MKRFERLRILLGMALLLMAAAAVIVCASPYAPVVEAAPENIEDIWAIEDAREESEVPLVTALQNHGQALGYDADKNTFYCTLGMDNGDAWPDIRLTAPQNPGVKLCFVDDYSYDWCSDAVMEGYPYQVTKEITISGFSSVSGKDWNLTSNPYMFRDMTVNDLDP